MNQKQKEMVERITAGKNPVCLHALGQGLADFLCEIIKIQAEQIAEEETFMPREDEIRALKGRLEELEEQIDDMAQANIEAGEYQ